MIVEQRHQHDPVLTQVIGSYVLATAEEMGVVLMRTAYSTNIKERGDFSTAIFDAAGRTLAQASHVPLHLAALMGLVEAILRDYPLESVRPGDIFLANDPYQGVGSQLNDIAVAAPVFRDGTVRAFVANIAHHSDVGGRFPGSEAAACTSIYEEGVRLPVMRLFDAGVMRGDIVRLIQVNSRVPRNVEGDLKAQVASLTLGVKRMEELSVRFPADIVDSCLTGWLDAAEARVRRAIDALPEGSYEFSDNVDAGGSDQLQLTVTITVRGSELTFDFSGCPVQQPNSHNATWLALLATVYYATKAVLDPGLPPNAGYFRALNVIAEPGTMVNATSPAAVGTRNHTCQKLVDVILGAFSQAVPTQVIAGSASSKLMIIGGLNPRSGQPFIDYEAFAGGLGARSNKDGLDVCRAHMTNTSNLPIEALEMEDPLLVVRYEMVPDTGGPGKFRGGLGVRRDTKMLGPGFEHSGFAIGHLYPGVGLQGGDRGRLAAGSMLVLNADSPQERVLDPMEHYLLQEGDVLSVFTPGGGGFGDPLERDPELVLHDLRESKITAEGALRDYGVIVHPDLTLDELATTDARRRSRDSRGALGS